MEIREFAEILLFGESLDEKHFCPDGGVRALTDNDPGPARAWETPGRPPELRVAPKRTRKRLPSPHALHDPEMRVRVLHTFANHELMAIELMAWALLAYPEAPKSFRVGLVNIILDEQRHLKLYADRVGELDSAFGALPVNDHFWRCAESLTDPLKWVCAMNLTFEQANLDHAPIYGEHFEAVGDSASAAIMQVIAEDELLHVGFGAKFLNEHTPAGRSSFDVFVENLTFYNSAERARGERFDAEARLKAGLDEEFVARMAELFR